MANPRAAKLLQWLALFIMALTASASISLDDIQPITSLSISRNCLLTYKIPIQGCTKDDFSGSKCSRSCATGILRIDALLQLSCPDDTAPADSLLALALGDQLLDHLCPDEPQTIPTPFESEGTTLTLTSVQPERTTSAKAWPTLTMRTSTTEMPTESTMSVSPVPSEGGKPPIAPESTVASESEPSSTTAMPLSTTLDSTLQISDTISGTTTSSAQTSVENPPIRGGGGSPFDLPAYVRSGQQKLSISAFGTAVGTLLLGALYPWF